MSEAMKEEGKAKFQRGDYMGAAKVGRNQRVSSYALYCTVSLADHLYRGFSCLALHKLLESSPFARVKCAVSTFLGGDVVTAVLVCSMTYEWGRFYHPGLRCSTCAWQQ